MARNKPTRDILLIPLPKNSPGIHSRKKPERYPGPGARTLEQRVKTDAVVGNLRARKHGANHSGVSRSFSFKIYPADSFSPMGWEIAVRTWDLNKKSAPANRGARHCAREKRAFVPNETWRLATSDCTCIRGRDGGPVIRAPCKPHPLIGRSRQRGVDGTNQCRKGI